MDKYGIIDKSTQHIPGDERSRTHPGHGYGEHTVTTTRITEYKDKGEWERAIRRKATPSFGQPEKFKAIVYREVEVQTHVKINIPG